MASLQRTAASYRLLMAVYLGALQVVGCTPRGDPAPPTVVTESVKTPAGQYAALVKDAKGISIGPEVSAYTVYVMFDPQCLHCARLWDDSKTLTGTVKFVWVPVNFLDGSNKSQSALLLGSSHPVEDMDRMMSAVLARTSGASSQDAVPPALEASIKSNTELINRFHVLGVPYVVARNQTTSEYVAREGGMSKEMLKQFLGIGSR